MKLPLKAIHYFETTARLGSYSDAARELYVSHGAVLAQVQKLENWLGVKLFVRRNGRIHLSEEGKMFAQRIAPAFTMLEQAVSDTRFAARHRIIISTIPSLAAHFLLPNIGQFHRLYPEVDLELHYCMDGQYLPESHFVLGYFDREHQPVEPNRHILFSAASVPVCGRGYLKTVEALSPQTIALHPLLHDHSKMAWQDWFARHDVDGCAVLPSQGAVFSDFNLLYTAVCNNNGIGLCPYILLYDEIVEGRLNVVSTQQGNLDRYYYVAINRPCKQSIQDGMTRWLLDLAQARCRQALGLVAV